MSRERDWNIRTVDIANHLRRGLFLFGTFGNGCIREDDPRRDFCWFIELPLRQARRYNFRGAKITPAARDRIRKIGTIVRSA